MIEYRKNIGFRRAFQIFNIRQKRKKNRKRARDEREERKKTVEEREKRERREKREERERRERRERREESEKREKKESEEKRDSALRVPRAETRLTVYRSIYIQMQIVSILPCPAAICEMRGSNSRIQIYIVENIVSTFRRDCTAYLSVYITIVVDTISKQYRF